jgi:hypothetical protein
VNFAIPNLELKPSTQPRKAVAGVSLKMNKLFLIALVCITATLAINKATASASLAQQFQTPPRAAQPWVYWVWVADTTPAALTSDLEQMKAKGIAGCILYDVQTGPNANWWKSKAVLVGKDYRAVRTDDYPHPYYDSSPTGLLPSWSPHWRELVDFAAGECHRLGISFVVSDGLANTSGPIPQKYGEQKLVWTETVVHGPSAYDGILVEPHFAAPKGEFPHPDEQSYHRDVAVLAVPDSDGFSTNQVINLTANMDVAGHLRWQVPAGNWRIIRFVQAPTLAHNEWGYYNDSLSTEAMDQTWAVTMAPLLKGMTPEQRQGITGIEDDSWEAGKATWTKLFPEEFQQRRGYDLIPWLPVIAGVKMSDANTRQRVLRDYNLTIGDLIADNHYGHLRKLADDNGLTFYSEAAGPNYDQADLLKTSGRVDMAMAEFWMPSAHRPTMDNRFLLRNAASANHIYGNPITMCESFTSLGPEWQVGPFDMKPVADQAFCDGLNKICVHNFSQSPSLTAKPGYVYVAGTHYEPGITWWNETPAFNSYLSRCSALLQAGKFVADAIFYHGDNLGHGEQRKTLQPTLGEGYDHDNCNSEVLLTRMSVQDEHIVLADGMSYRVLVLPAAQPMPLADLEKVANLVKAGATVVGPSPTRLAGMPLHTNDEQKFDALVARLWGGLDGTNTTQKTVGTGRMIWGQTARQVLQAENVPPDFEVRGVSDAGTIDWIHRRTDDAEIYFVASRWAHPENVVGKFRVSGKQPELWDPVTGEMRDATAFQQADGRTSLPLKFDPCGSVFVVFRRTIPTEVAGTTVANDPSTHLLDTLSGPWMVNFDPKWGGPASVVFDQLMDWTNSSVPGIKYYSGTAFYTRKFDLPSGLAPGERLLLDLGDVHEVASVQINGKDLGVVWAKPARVDITSAVKATGNELKIKVVNLWPNRLIGDASLPAKERFTETNIRSFAPTSPLLSSGLVGPVSLLTATAPLPQ